MAAILHAATKKSQFDAELTAKLQDLSLNLLDANKRCYGLCIDGKMYMCSLVDMPCIIEAQKTLDHNTFYKSCDASQMMYVHNTCIEGYAEKTQD